jgi:hypothetical protein
MSIPSLQNVDLDPRATFLGKSIAVGQMGGSNISSRKVIHGFKLGLAVFLEDETRQTPHSQVRFVSSLLAITDADIA